MINIHDPGDFRYTGCSEDVAITITFSDKEVE